MDQTAKRCRREGELEHQVEVYLGYLREGVEAGLVEIYLNRIAEAERKLILLRANRPQTPASGQLIQR